MAKAKTTTKHKTTSKGAKQANAAFRAKLTDRKMLILVAGVGLVSSCMLALKALLASY